MAAKREEVRDDQSSDSELEVVEQPRALRSTGMKRRKILDCTNIANVPIYSGRVSRTLTLYQENPQELDREFQKRATASDSEGDPEGECEPGQRRGQKRKRPLSHARKTGWQSDSEEDDALDLSLSSSHRDRSPSPPSSPATPAGQTRRAQIAIREADRKLKELEVLHFSPLKDRVQCESDDVIVVGVVQAVPRTPREITVKLRCRERIYRVPMRMTDPLQKAIVHLASSLEVDADRVLLLRKDVEVPLSETPESQNISVADILDCFVMSEREAKCEDRICLRVRGAEKNSFQDITIGKAESLKRLMEDYKERMGLRHCRLTFHFDGSELSESSTPQENDMESDDVIDVRMWSS